MEEFEDKCLKAKVKISVFALSIISIMTTDKKTKQFLIKRPGECVIVEFRFRYKLTSH